MATILETARQFFDACESGKGWADCNSFCHPDASFSSQTGALAEISTLEGYCDWMRDLFTPIPDGRYELKFFAADDSTNSVAAYAVFHGTQTGPGGPVPATGKSVASDYVYHIAFEGDRIKHMTKIWNDTIGLQQLGWG
ncbi:MAG: nuclear transport factor 2 family protein [Halieaceae bacterium]|jgi:predicted ester cyclase|nr:nuclear transport factor 2 family protein [Halieaceae bacterium]